jgi:superfamily I DNA/RNA helicase
VARLAIAKGFLAEYAKLEKDVQRAVETVINQFAEQAHALPLLDQVPGSRDSRIRTIQVDSFLRGVVLAPESGDTYYLITVLPREKAASYASSHRFSVNQALGVLEVRDEKAIQQAQPALAGMARSARHRLFAGISDADLARLGVDAQILPVVRLLNSKTDLETLQAMLPDAQYAALHALASQMTVAEAWAEVAQLLPGDAPEQVDPDDLVSAMKRTPGHVTFVSGQGELRRILAHPFATWRTFLLPSQLKIAYRPSYSGPSQVTGGPGTGKTVTALHRAAFLAARAAPAPGGTAAQSFPVGLDAGPVLLTTFTSNLTEALDAQLDVLIEDPDVRRLIEVINVDRLAYNIVKQARGTPAIADERILRARWSEATADAGLAFTPAFLKNEWEQVILAQDLRTEDAYLTCLRTGRGQRLRQAQRSQVWHAAQRVAGELAAARQSTPVQLADEAAHLLRQAGAPYRHVIVDEGQDLHPAQWRLLRAAVPTGPDDLFIAADPHQRIYDNRVSLASLGIMVRGRSRRLSVNYRTTQEILSWTVPLLGPDPAAGLDGEVDSLLGYRSPMRGELPQLRMTATRAEEFSLLSERIRSWLDSGIEAHAIAVAARSADMAREAHEALKARGITVMPLSRRGSAQAVRVGTMHGTKGLEFQAVAVIGVEQGQVPLASAITPASEDTVAHAQDVQRERCVLFVACTRARDHLYVSGTGAPSPFLPYRSARPPAVFRPSAEPPGEEAAPTTQEAEPGDSEEPGPVGAVESACAARPAAPRKVGTWELLRLREEKWAPRLRAASLVAEAELQPDHTDQVAAALGRQYGGLPDPRLGGEPLLLRWPACLAVAMAGVAASRYQDGTYWPALWDTARFPGTAQDQGIWGRAFNAAVGRLGMATFPGLPLTFLGPILMHAGIPTYCLDDYFRLLLSRRRHDPGLDAESFLAWATAPGRGRRLADLDVPARRFITDGGDYALDVVDRSLDLLDRLAGPDPDLGGIALPARIVDAAREAVTEHGPEHPALRRGAASAGASHPRPRIALDPYGEGVQVILPAVGEAPDGVATWRVTADGDPVVVRSRAQWVGAAEAAPQTAHPLARPVRTVHVSLVGWDHVSELEVIRPEDPVLFFADDGRRLPAQLPLPPDQLWILYPADRELAVAGELRTIAEVPAPFGWEGWQLRLASLEHARSVALLAGPVHVVQGYARPRLLLGQPLAGVTTPYGSPVYAEPPRLWVPDTPGADVRWHADIRPAAGGPPLVSRQIDQPGEADIWDGVPRPVLGAFEITVRGPLGRGTRRTVFVAEGIAVSYQPPVRALRERGLEPGAAMLRAPVGATVSPGRLSFGTAEHGQVAELRAGTETEPVVITPPHVTLLCAGAGTATWTAAPIHATTETAANLGRLLVRAPGAAVQGSLQVWAGRQQIQAIEASGGAAPGLAGYDLARASETIAHHHRAELYLPWGQGAMPVGFVRPRRLATGAEISAGRLLIRDCVPVAGLTAALYLTRAPWRPPVVLPVPGDGAIQLPPGLDESGPARVLLRVLDPWADSDWPDWPDRTAFLCRAAGVPASTDPEEQALSRVLAQDGDLPEQLVRPERLWRILNLADDLIAAGAAPDLRVRCSAALRDQPGPALAALLDADLDARACIATLISAGLASTRPVPEGRARAAERLWGVIPAAAAVLSSRLLSQAAGLGEETVAAVADAALAQCGPALDAVLADGRDPAAQVGQFGPDAERMAVLPVEQLEAVWQAAAVVPQALLDPDTRVVAARQMFDARRSPELTQAARDAGSILRAAQHLVAASPYRRAGAQVSARLHPDRKGAWTTLPAVSAALAVVARIGARGDVACQSFECHWRDHWAGLARQAPDLASIDLVLAEILIASADRARITEEPDDAQLRPAGYQQPDHRGLPAIPQVPAARAGHPDRVGPG